jgi:hypothetical protein
MSTWVHPRFCWRGPYCSSLNFLCSLVFFVLCVIVLWPVFPTCDLCSQPVTCVPNLWPVLSSCDLCSQPVTCVPNCCLCLWIFYFDDPLYFLYVYSNYTGWQFILVESFKLECYFNTWNRLHHYIVTHPCNIHLFTYCRFK